MSCFGADCGGALLIWDETVLFHSCYFIIKLVFGFLLKHGICELSPIGQGWGVEVLSGGKTVSEYNC